MYVCEEVKRDEPSFFLSDPFAEIVGTSDVFVDSHSAVNLTCVVHSPEPPDHIFWLKSDRVSGVNRGGARKLRLICCQPISMLRSLPKIWRRTRFLHSNDI